MGLVRNVAWPSRCVEWAGRVRREEGVARLCFRVARKCLSPIIEWGGVTFFERTLDNVEPSPLPPGITVREAVADDVAALSDGLDPEQDQEEITRRLRRGDRLFAAFDATGRCAHTRWVTRSATYVPEIDCALVPAPGQAYFYNGYTRPDRRGHGIDGAVRNAIFAALKSEGHTAACSYVRRDNRVGLRAAARWQRPIGSVSYVRVARFRPIVRRQESAGGPTLVRSTSPELDRTRAEAWRQWFGGFAARPLAQRSTGCDVLPDAYFHSAAAYIASTLRVASSDAVLDVGCDSAMISRLVAPDCRRFTGIDLIPEMLRDGRDRLTGGAAHARLVAADARYLPIRSEAFQKVYCSAMLHTLPARADGLAVIDELIRVTAPGGQVLVCSVPDCAKRFVNRGLVWRRAGWIGRLTLPLRWATPSFVKQLGRRIVRRPPTGPPAFLDYDLRDIARTLEARGLHCTVKDFPVDYWSTDFRATRSNLLISVGRNPR